MPRAPARHMLMRLYLWCPDCTVGREVTAMVAAEQPVATASYVLLPVLLALFAVRWWSSRAADRSPLIVAGVVLGVGLGGFVDGIVLHQILQWHSMLSSHTPPTDLVAMKFNMVWDGVFHAAMWVTCALGVGLLFRARRAPQERGDGRRLVGAMLAGWGLFNLVEGVIDHHLLGLHHVHPGVDELAWDLGFLVFAGVGLIIVGAAIARDRRRS